MRRSSILNDGERRYWSENTPSGILTAVSAVIHQKSGQIKGLFRE